MSKPTYPFDVLIEVVFRDIDAFTHVNNAVYFTYFETARTKFVAHVLGVDRANEIPLILAEANCTYKTPAYLGEKLRVGMRMAHIGTKSFHLEYEVVSDADGRLVALGRTVQVMYDYDTGQTVPIPPDVRAKFQQYR